MNLPVSVDDPSLREHEPLHSYIAIFEEVRLGGQRAAANQVVSQFIKAMQQNDQAAAAAKKWACLVFTQDALSEESTLTDGGEELFRIFFKYEYVLCKEGADEAFKYETQIHKRGIRAIKAIEVKDNGGSTQRSAQERGHQGITRRQAKPGANLSDAVLAPAARLDPTATVSSLGHGSRSRLASPAIRQGAFDSTPASDARRSVLPMAAEPSTRLPPKKDKKRKASSQKPLVITPSDASEDDKELHAVSTAGSISHRSKRIASNPRQTHDSIGDENQVDKANSAHRAEESEQQRQGATSISQTESSLTSFRSDDLVSHPSMKGKRGAPPPLSGRKHGGERCFNGSTLSTGRDFNSRVRKTKSVGDLQPRRNKRLRRASKPILENAPEEGTEPTTRGPLVTGPPSTRRHIHVELKARKKRNRLEFETTLDENASPESHEVLGPDDRQLRPLPKKICHVRSAQFVHGVPSGAPSLEHADQLLRDVASNALAVLGEGVEPDLPDWTQDKEHDEEDDDPVGDGQDEASNIQVTTSTPTLQSLPSQFLHLYGLNLVKKSASPLSIFVATIAACTRRITSSRVTFLGHILQIGTYSVTTEIDYFAWDRGGKSESIISVRGGPKRYQTDQDQEASDKTVRALLKTWKDRRPIVLLADDKYALFPCDLTSGRYTYVVLGLYWISHAWGQFLTRCQLIQSNHKLAERQSARDGSGRVVRWKFAFQWCEGQSDPWWLPQEMKATTSDPPKVIPNPRMCPTKGSSHTANTGGNPSIQCDNCQEQSPFVYMQGWMCLNPRCDVFWSIDGEDPKQLDYREDFLSLLPQKFERLPDITPVKVMVSPGGVTTTYACSKGWHCSKCGRLSCRYKWEHWECSNCKYTHAINGRVRSPKEFWHQQPSKGFLHSQVRKDSGILACRLEPINLGGNKGFTNRLTFILPHRRGQIHLILGTPLSNRDADEIFQLYQQQAATGELKLRRYPLRNVARGLLLTNYFSQNSGEPYQYVGGSGQTVPFSEAPDCVRRALALIKERSSLALCTDIPFNEILSAGYMERQKMSFHSDSEKGLGPTVGSLSLGSAALMHFRPHVSAETSKAKCTHALTLVLRHGDVLIMDGDGVQKYYDSPRPPSPSIAEQDTADPAGHSITDFRPPSWMSRQKVTAIEHLTKLTRRGRTPAQVEAATDNGADSADWSPSPTLHEVQTYIDTQNNVKSAVADDPAQSPEPIGLHTFAKRMQDMFSTIPSFASTVDAPPPIRDHPHLLSSLTLPNFENSPLEHGWKSFLSTLGRLRLPYAKSTSASSSEPFRDDVLDCMDDNNSVMMYGPLEPDDTSEVEIACSEIVSINGDGEEIRTPQPCYSPLPSESIDDALMGCGPRTPPPSFVPLPMESIDQVLMGGGREMSTVLWKESGSEVPEPAADQPPVKEYRVWLPSPTKISIQTMWWGFRLYLPPPVLDVLNNKQLEAAKRAALITTALQWLMDHLPLSLLPPQMHPGVAILRYLVPYVGYMGGFIAWTWSAVRSFDKGYGVVLTATWLLPFVLIPGTWEAEEIPNVNTSPRPSFSAPS
ncbi:2OG-Fe(II) oxygenase superfamily-domain-containing protein [Boletus reticuloceps]|uniref:2OG-Fe(II) oxygenase superfamily-domain-containing protein n=1 Tax=Boletus reticuloceps TaxID=495285 RepID=A0A8I3AAE1_9AGAM|nr:2OG-Fe(II) oxygenase superfamily-domain-containing protein [Boletus reticuloceps]